MLAAAEVMRAGLLVGQGAFDRALEAASGALAHGGAESDVAAWALYWQARVFDARGRPRSALERATRAIELVESVRGGLAAEYRAAFAGTVHELYELQVDLLMRLGQTDAALAARERGAARSLVEALGQCPRRSARPAGHPVDGSLRLHDVWRMEVAADLVVLSGCDTTSGRVVRGEGVVTLDLAPGEMRVVTDIYRRVIGGDVGSGFALVRSVGGGAAGYAFGSLVDNVTGDAAYIPAR